VTKTGYHYLTLINYNRTPQLRMRKKTGSKTSSGLNKRKTMMDTNADRSKPRKLEPEVYVNRC